MLFIQYTKQHTEILIATLNWELNYSDRIDLDIFSYRRQSYSREENIDGWKK